MLARGGWKLERVFFNLILNACEAASTVDGSITIDVRKKDDGFEIRVEDNGPGIPASIRSNLFEAFVSYGKPNGTGLGLAIVSKIVQDHSGTVVVEKTSEAGTAMVVRLPFSGQVSASPPASARIQRT